MATHMPRPPSPPSIILSTTLTLSLIATAVLCHGGTPVQGGLAAGR
jgi:hypothetical protein